MVLQFASHASIELLNKKIVPGIYYATDIIKGDIVLGDLPKLNIDLNISECGIGSLWIRHKKKNGEITNESCYNVWWK